MRKHPYWGSLLAGACAGMVAGLFGAGGGMVLVPLLTVLTDWKEDAIFPSSVAIILPICITALAVSLLKGPLPFREALPYMIGSGIGGYFAGIWGKKIPVQWLHRGLGILILWGGYRYLC